MEKEVFEAAKQLAYLQGREDGIIIGALVTAGILGVGKVRQQYKLFKEGFLGEAQEERKAEQTFDYTIGK